MVSSMKTLWKMPFLCHCIVLALSLGIAHSNSPAAEVSADLHWRGKSKLRRKGCNLSTSPVSQKASPHSPLPLVLCASVVFSCKTWWLLIGYHHPGAQHDPLLF